MSIVYSRKKQLSANITFFFGTPFYTMWLREATETLLKKWQKVGEDGAKEFTQNKIP